jgi:PAS domain S-box-containing protein
MHPSKYLLHPPSKEKNYKRLTLRNTFWNLVLFVIPFVLLFFTVNHGVTSLIKQQIYKNLANTVEENIKTINTFLQDREVDLKPYAKLDIDNVQEVTKFSPFFQSLIQEKRWYDFLIISDLNGEVILTINTDKKRNVSDREYFRIAKSGTPFTSGIFYSDIMGSALMMVSHPLYNRRNMIVGVLAASLNLQNFYNLLYELQMGKTSELFLVDEEGTLLSPTKLGGRLFKDKGFDQRQKNPHTGEEGVKTHTDYRGQKVLCAYKRAPQFNFYVVSEMDLKEALLPLRNVNRNILYVFTPFLLVLIIISNLYSRRITFLLRRLTRNLESTLNEAQKKKKEVDAINIELEEKIKESKNLTEELKHSEEYIRNLIDSISIGVVGLDHTGRITHFNKEIKEIFHIDESKKGQKIFSLLPWLDNKDIRASFQNTLKAHKPQRIEEKFISPSNGEGYYYLSFFPIERAEGEIAGVTLLIENITERRRLREQLAEYEKLSALSQLALGAAHEINNPLLGISSYLENLQEVTKERKGKEEIAFVLENVYRISETIRGLLNFARPMPPQFTKVNINQLIDETLSFLSHQPIFRKAKIIKSLTSPLPQITADLNQIRQVLINMLINAAQSMPNGGELKVQTSKIKFKEWVKIDISDTGEGISPENQKRIFDPFFTTKKGQGTGLGLSISLSYIKNHSGEITFHSELKKGTTFSIFLPIRQKGKILMRNEETIS